MSDQPVSQHCVLAIDDDPYMLELVSMILRPYVARVETCNDPREGLRLAMTFKPDLILLDNNMPGMNGTEVLQQLRQMPATAAIPVIMLSADNSLETLQTVVKDNVNGYLLKPWDHDVFLETVAPWLDLRLPPQPQELTEPLFLSPDQSRQLELRSLFSAVSLLSNELSLLTLATRDQEILKPVFAGIKDFREALSRPGQSYEILGDLEAFGHLLFAQVEALIKAHPGLAASLPPETCRSNLQALFRSFRQRAHELLERMDDTWMWKTLPTGQVHQHLINTLEACGSNSLSDYSLRYQRLNQPLAGYHVEVEIQGPEPDRVRIPLALQDVMRELVSNAYRHTARSGWLSSKLTLTHDKLTLSVADGGSGLSTESLSQLLSEIPRNDRGLTRAYAVTRALGGRMWLLSSPGEGTTVSLEIPVSD